VILYPTLVNKGKGVAMSVKVREAVNFRQAWKYLTPQLRRIVRNKIDLLAENPGHPSLNAHRLRQVREDIWVCYISNSMRLLYEYKEDTLYLWDLGNHSIVDRVHLRRFAS